MTGDMTLQFKHSTNSPIDENTAMTNTRTSCCLLLAATLTALTATPPLEADVVANLVTDYTEGGAVIDTTPATFAGTVSGTWNALSDNDSNPFNGGTATLLFRSSVGLEGGDGFAGSGTVAGDPGCCGPFPILSDNGLFDGVTTPPAGTLVIHPGDSGASGGLPLEYLVLQYTATTELSGVGINYSFNQPNPGSDGIDVTLFNNAGTQLNQFFVDNATVAGAQYVGELSVGESFYAVIGNGPSDNVGADQSFIQLSVEDGLVDPGIFEAHIDRDTQTLTLFNGTPDAIDVIGFSILSASGGLISSNWTSVTDNYDADSGPTSGVQIDADDNWLELVSSKTELGEIELNTRGSQDGGAIDGTPNPSIPVVVDLGDVWLKSVYEDVQIELLRTDGTVEIMDVVFSGNGGEAFARSDLNTDGSITALDWDIFRNGLDTDVSALTLAEAYLQGDLDGDLDVDIDDFGLFKIDFMAAHPEASSFEAAVTGVPEPSSLVLLLTLGILSTALERSHLMRLIWKSCRTARVLACCVLMFTTASMSLAVEVANLANDYTEASAVADTTPAVFTGTTSGTWTASSDDDANPLNGGLASLLYRSAVGLEGGNGYAGTGTVFNNCCGPFPIVSNDGLFDGVTTLPTGTVAIHPGQSGSNEGPEFLVLQYTATSDLSKVTIGFSFNQAAAGSDGIDVTLLNNSGAVIGSHYVDGTTVTGSNFVGNLGIGESLFAVVGNGAADNPGGDQTFANLTIEDNTVPTTLALVVNTVTGKVELANQSDQPIDFDYYTIKSAGGALDKTGWNSLQEQNLQDFPAGTGTGDGWEESGGSGTSVLTEAYLLSNSQLAAESSVSLGNAFDEQVFGFGLDGDLSLQYRLPDGTVVDGFVFYDDTVPTGLPGDFNDDGTVNIADYTVWRNNLGSSFDLNGNGDESAGSAGVVDVADYDLWKSNFGNTTQNASLVASQVPEPSTWVALLCGLALAKCAGRQSSPRAVWVMGLALTVSLFASSSKAAFDDRSYLFGDDPLEDAANAIGGVVGTGPGNVSSSDNTLDSAGSTGVSFQDLSVSGSPTYTTGALSPRGISFDGLDDRLSVAESFNSPDLFWNSTFFPSMDYPFNYDGLNTRGMQVWAKSVGEITSQQTIVADTHQHALTITDSGNWAMRFDGPPNGPAGGVLFDSGLSVSSTGQTTGANLDEVAANGYTHLMALSGPYLSASQTRVYATNGSGSALGGMLYINGVAVMGTNDIYYDPDMAELSIGSALEGSGEFFTGDLDDLRLFVWGDNSDTAETNMANAMGADYGALNLGETNEWIKQELSERGVTSPGDVNLDAVIDGADITAFVEDWRKVHLVPDAGGGMIPAGDWVSRRDNSDLNYDGLTNYHDAFILHQALVEAGLGGLDFSVLGEGSTVPEPSAVLVLLSFVGAATGATLDNGPPPAKLGSVQYFLLPYLEEEPLYNEVYGNPQNSMFKVKPGGGNQAIYCPKAYRCPSEVSNTDGMARADFGGLHEWPAGNLVANIQALYHIGTRHPNHGSWPEQPRERGYPKHSQMLDGTSKTAVFTERYTHCPLPITSTTPRTALFGTYPTEYDSVFAWNIANCVPLINLPQISPEIDSSGYGEICDGDTVQSWHTGVLNVALMDGSVQGITGDIDINTWTFLIMPADGGVLPTPGCSPNGTGTYRRHSSLDGRCYAWSDGQVQPPSDRLISLRDGDCATGLPSSQRSAVLIRFRGLQHMTLQNVATKHLHLPLLAGVIAVFLAPVSLARVDIGPVPFASDETAVQLVQVGSVAGGTQQMAVRGENFYFANSTGTIEEFTKQPDGSLLDKAGVFLDVAAERGGAFSRHNGLSGLRGIAFHPDFDTTGTDGFGKFYTQHIEAPLTPPNHDLRPEWATTPDAGINQVVDSVLFEWSFASEGELQQTLQSSREVYRVRFPAGHHVGQQIGFNPTAQSGEDDYGNLYMTFGESGGKNNAAGMNDFSSDTIITTAPQDPLTPLGKIIRINPLASGADSFTIPSNLSPFPQSPDALPELYAAGFRNPQTLSFDTETGRLFVGDIGQLNVEEINLIAEGGNYGWSLREGTYRFDTPFDADTLVEDPLAVRQQDSFIDPVAQFDHLDGGNTQAVVAGFVYHGTLAPQLSGKFLFSSLSTDRIYFADATSLVNDDNPSDIFQLPLVDELGGSTSLGEIVGSGRANVRFGQDEDGEIYVISKANGGIYRFQSLPLLGDLDSNGFINALDWQRFRAGMDTDLSELSLEDAYKLGDMDGDRDNDVDDFSLFKQAYLNANGPDSLSQLVTVPEHFETSTPPEMNMQTQQARSILFALTLLTLACATTDTVSAQPVTFESLLTELTDRDSLATHPDSKYLVKQASSYDRASVAEGEAGWFANSDWSRYIRSEQHGDRTEWVLFDESGPGAVTRFWAGGHPDQDAMLRFYLDGSDTPFWAGRASELVGQNLELGPILSSRSYDQDVLDGGAKPGHNLYAPVPYSQGLKITYDAPPGGTDTGLWYGIVYRDYEDGTNVASFDPSSLTTPSVAAKITQANSQLVSPDTAPRGAGNQQVTNSGAVAAGQTLTQSISGAGAVKRLRLNLNASDMAAALRDTKLEISFDGNQTVQAPVGHFFGTGNDQVLDLREWYRTIDSSSGDMTAYWTMPYRRHADIRVVNTGSQDVEVDLQIETGDWQWTEDSMYFHANYREQFNLPTTAQVGQDWNYLAVLGKGLYVGDTLQVSKDIAGWWGEGDEKIFVDGEQLPSHFGTGTEDYYGYAWGHRETFSQPFISQPQAGANYLNTGGTTINSRTRSLDAIPFNQSLRFDMEVWNWHGGPVDYSVATFWYGAPGAVVLTEENLGDLNLNGQLDPGDWALYIAGLDRDMSGLSLADRYLSGDLDFDGDNDVDDFNIFKQRYVSVNGHAAFQQLGKSIPEPASIHDFNERKGKILRIYLDGNPEPTLEANFFDLVMARWKVPAPFAQPTCRAGDLYLPIPFQKSCKVTLEDDSFFYIINYRGYEQGTKVEAFELAMLDEHADLIDAVGTRLQVPQGQPPGELVSLDKAIASKNTESLLLPQGGAAISHLEIKLDAKDLVQALRSTVLEITFDDEQTIWCPIGDFFANVNEIDPYRMWEREVKADGTMVCRWMMPYQSSGRVRIHNLSTDPVSVHLKAVVVPRKWDSRSLHFHANWWTGQPSAPRPVYDLNFIEIQGRGLHVGDNFIALNPHWSWWGEGDEKIYVDEDFDRKFPSHFGTGTEDYYGWAGGVVPTRDDEFSSPFLANIRVGGQPHPHQEANQGGRPGPYTRGYNICSRTRALDATPFNSRFRLDMEAFNMISSRDAYLQYALVTFWYGQPGAQHNRKPLPEAAAARVPAPEDVEAFVQSQLTNQYRIANAIECEGLELQLTPNRPRHNQEIGNLYAPHKFSSESICFVQTAEKGDSAVFVIGEQYQPRHIVLHPVTAGDFGILSIYVNDERVLTDWDGYTPKPEAGDFDMSHVRSVLSVIALSIAATHYGAPMVLAEEFAFVEESSDDRDDRLAWWRDARFGMFIHWGVYAIPAGEWEGKQYDQIAEWLMDTAKIPAEKYEKLGPQFNPTGYDPAQWAQTAADAGMKYLVITSKHHDGFCLFDTEATDWDVVDATPYGKDLLRPLAEECRKRNIRFCTYYSIMDWHHPAQEGFGAGMKEGRKREYVDYMKMQLKELIDSCCPDVLWFDGEWPAWWTEEDGKDLYAYLRTLKPSIIVNNRVGKGRKGMSGLNKSDQVYAGDFGTPEQEIPSQGLTDVDWESCMTMNTSWGYKHFDQNWKDSKMLVRNLVDIASKGGNYLLNVGPKADGTIPQESIARLEEMGEWMEKNGASIYGTKASPFERPAWGRYTVKNIDDDSYRLFVHVFDWPESKTLRIPVAGVESAVLLATGKPLEVTHSEGNSTVLQLPTAAPDSIDTVVELAVRKICRSAQRRQTPTTANIVVTLMKSAGDRSYSRSEALRLPDDTDCEDQTSAALPQAILMFLLMILEFLNTKFLPEAVFIREQLAAETCVALWEMFDQYQSNSDFGAWARSVARYRILKHRERSKKGPVLLNEQLLDRIAERADHLADHLEDRREALQGCLQKLASRDRELIERAYDPTLKTVKQVAESLERPANTVYKALRRIRGELANLIAEFMSLCDALQLGTASEEDARLLEQSLSTHDYLIDLYIEKVHSHATLRLTAGPTIRIGLDTEACTVSPLGAEAQLAEGMPRIHLGVNATSDSEQRKSDSARTLWNGLAFPARGLAIAALLGAIAMGATFFHAMRDRSREEVLKQHATTEIDAVDLEQGSVRLRLPQVGYLIAEGPSRFTLVSPMRLELEKGRIRVRVTEESGHGFVVATKHGEITDLGTEFGVDASSADSSDVVVFDGAVDLRVANQSDQLPAQRLIRGEGVRFSDDGELNRIMSIATGTASTFIDIARDDQAALMAETDHVILDVRDNIRAKQTKNFYEVVYEGFSNQVQAYVDRDYLWGSRDKSAFPETLNGADYVKTFNNDKLLDIQIEIRLAAPCDLYLVWDDRVPPTEWLARDFTETGWAIERFELGVKDLGTDEARDNYLVATTTAHAQVEFDTISGAADFTDDLNWVGGFVPTAADRALINTSTTAIDYVYLAGDGEAQNLTLGETNGQTGVLEIRDGGTLTLAGAASGGARVGYVGNNGSGELHLLAGSQLLAGSEASFVDMRLGSASGSVGTASQEVNSLADINGVLYLGTSAGSSGTYTMNGGRLNIETILIVGRAGEGTFTQLGGDITVNRDGSNDPAMYVGSNSGGDGYYEISGGSLTLTANANGGLRLGSSSGASAATLKIVGDNSSISIGTNFVSYPNSILSLDIDSGITPVDVMGDATLEGLLNVSFSTQPAVGDSFTILNYGGNLVGEFDSLDMLVDGPNGSDTVMISIDYGAGANSAITISVVPEPSAGMIVGLLAMAACGGVVPADTDRAVINYAFEGDLVYLDSATTAQNLVLAGISEADPDNAFPEGRLELRNGSELILLGAESGSTRVGFVGETGFGQLTLLAGSSFILEQGDLYVSDEANSSAQVTQTAGSSVEIGGALILGVKASTDATYTMSGGILTTEGFFLVGRAGSGQLTQTAGDIMVNRGTPEEPATDPGLYIGSNDGSTGYYEISGGSLSVSADNGGFRIGRADGTATSTFRIVGDAAAITVGSNLELFAGGSTIYEASTGVTAIDVAGDVTLAGALDMSFSSAPMLGDEYTLIEYGGNLQGTYAGIDPFISFAGVPFVVSYGLGQDSAVRAAVVPGEFTLGDFDLDDDIDAADYEALLASFNTGELTGTIWGNYQAGDINFDTIVDYTDAQLFRTAFDTLNGSGSFKAMVESSSVPEPPTWLCLATGVFGLAVICRYYRKPQALAAITTGLAILFVVACSGTATAQITYVDAVNGVNTFRTNGDAIPLEGEGSATTDGVWDFRTDLGINSSAWQSFYRENVDILKVTIDGLDTTFSYNVYAHFWSNASQNWRVEGTLDPADINDNGTPGDLSDDFLPAEAGISFNAKGASDGTTQASVALLSEFAAPAPIVTESDRTLYNAYLGSASPNENDEIPVYIDNYYAEGDTSGRIFFDGVGYEVQGVDLTLEVQADGSAKVVNTSSVPISIDYYEINSSAGNLSYGGWSSLESQLVGSVDGSDLGSMPGDSSTEKWGVTGGSEDSNTQLSEFYLPGYLELGTGQEWILGSPVAAGTAANDLTFRVGVEGYGVLDARVAVVGGDNADFNGDGIVSIADYTVWRNNLGASGSGLAGDANADNTVDAVDYQIWKTQFGTMPASATGLAVHDQIDFSRDNNVSPNTEVLCAFDDRSLLCPSDSEAGRFDNAREPIYLPGSAGTFSLGMSYIPSGGPLKMNFCPYGGVRVDRELINCKADRGGAIGIGTPKPYGAPGMFAGGPDRYKLKNCSDGTSNTLLIGETLPIYNSFHMYFASHMNVATSHMPLNYHLIDPTCPHSPSERPPGDCYAKMAGFKSNHPGGVNIALADGSVQFFRDEIDYSTLQFLGDKADGYADSRLRPCVGQLGEDGRYQMRAFPKQIGIAPGKYRVAVQAYTGSHLDGSVKYLVPERFANADTSKLEVEVPAAAFAQVEPIADGSWTLAVLPDTQVYAERYPAHFDAQTQWIVEHVDSHNIKYVLHEGDVTNRNTIEQWDNALQSLSILDGKVPYAIAPGNHDYGPGGNGATRDSYHNEPRYFGPGSPYAKQESIGGFYEDNKTDNSWHVFEAGGKQWLVLALEWGPRDEVVDWAKSVVESHPDHLAMLVTHAYMYFDDTIYDWKTKGAKQHWNPHAYGIEKTTRTSVNDGQELWDKLVSRHPSFRLTFNGHVLQDGAGFRSTEGKHGNPVHQMLANYQMNKEGGMGDMRLLEFKPDGKTVVVRTYSPVLDRHDDRPHQKFVLALDHLGLLDSESTHHSP
ncbi:Alpha-L-fucosidase (Alpha-L-fucoside fucohydrolase) [Durusdinium trenchii]|uniref:alpha-L-fucosidase n=1 Tax=Durusdinium trenchii TaxID=1381693 RepID=A0ABP0LEZ4_9DINO